MKITRYLWISNLPKSCGENDIRQTFESHGKIQTVRIHENGNIRGAIVAFIDCKSSTKAFESDHKIKDLSIKMEYCEANGEPGLTTMGLSTDDLVKKSDNQSTDNPEFSCRSRSGSNTSSFGSSLDDATKYPETKNIEDFDSSTNNQESTMNDEILISSQNNNGINSVDKSCLNKEHRGLLLENLSQRSSDTSLREGLFHEYKKHGKITSVSILGQGSSRYAIISFKRSEDMEKAFEVSQGKIFFGNKIKVKKHYGFNYIDPDLCPPEHAMDEYHPKATKTLFVGKLTTGCVSETDLKRTFKKYGEIIDIDMKTQSNQPDTSFAFVQYYDISSVVRALRNQDNIKIDGKPVKLGFGKSQPTNCLWLGNLSSRSSTETNLRRQFRRHGSILFVMPDVEYACALIQFECVDDAQRALQDVREKSNANCNSSNNVTNNNNTRRIQVDFASNEYQIAFMNRLRKSCQFDKHDFLKNCSEFSQTEKLQNLLISCTKYLGLLEDNNHTQVGYDKSEPKSDYDDYDDNYRSRHHSRSSRQKSSYQTRNNNNYCDYNDRDDEYNDTSYNRYNSRANSNNKHNRMYDDYSPGPHQSPPVSGNNTNQRYNRSNRKYSPTDRRDKYYNQYNYYSHNRSYSPSPVSSIDYMDDNYNNRHYSRRSPIHRPRPPPPRRQSRVDNDLECNSHSNNNYYSSHHSQNHSHRNSRHRSSQYQNHDEPDICRSRYSRSYSHHSIHSPSPPCRYSRSSHSSHRRRHDSPLSINDNYRHGKSSNNEYNQNVDDYTELRHSSSSIHKSNHSTRKNSVTSTTKSSNYNSTEPVINTKLSGLSTTILSANTNKINNSTNTNPINQVPQTVDSTNTNNNIGQPVDTLSKLERERAKLLQELSMLGEDSINSNSVTESLLESMKSKSLTNHVSTEIGSKNNLKSNEKVLESQMAFSSNNNPLVVNSPKKSLSKPSDKEVLVTHQGKSKENHLPSLNSSPLVISTISNELTSLSTISVSNISSTKLTSPNTNTKLVDPRLNSTTLNTNPTTNQSYHHYIRPLSSLFPLPASLTSIDIVSQDLTISTISSSSSCVTVSPTIPIVNTTVMSSENINPIVTSINSDSDIDHLESDVDKRIRELDAKLNRTVEATVRTVDYSKFRIKKKSIPDSGISSNSNNNNCNNNQSTMISCPSTLSLLNTTSIISESTNTLINSTLLDNNSYSSLNNREFSSNTTDFIKSMLNQTRPKSYLLDGTVDNDSLLHSLTSVSTGSVTSCTSLSSISNMSTFKTVDLGANDIERRTNSLYSRYNSSIDQIVSSPKSANIYNIMKPNITSPAHTSSSSTLSTPTTPSLIQDLNAPTKSILKKNLIPLPITSSISSTIYSSVKSSSNIKGPTFERHKEVYNDRNNYSKKPQNLSGSKRKSQSESSDNELYKPVKKQPKLESSTIFEDTVFQQLNSKHRLSKKSLKSSTNSIKTEEKLSSKKLISDNKLLNSKKNVNNKKLQKSSHVNKLQKEPKKSVDHNKFISKKSKSKINNSSISRTNINTNKTNVKRRKNMKFKKSNRKNRSLISDCDENDEDEIDEETSNSMNEDDGDDDLDDSLDEDNDDKDMNGLVINGSRKDYNENVGHIFNLKDDEEDDEESMYDKIKRRNNKSKRQIKRRKLKQEAGRSGIRKRQFSSLSGRSETGDDEQDDDFNNYTASLLNKYQNKRKRSRISELSDSNSCKTTPCGVGGNVSNEVVVKEEDEIDCDEEIEEDVDLPHLEVQREEELSIEAKSSNGDAPSQLESMYDDNMEPHINQNHLHSSHQQVLEEVVIDDHHHHHDTLVMHNNDITTTPTPILPADVNSASQILVNMRSYSPVEEMKDNQQIDNSEEIKEKKEKVIVKEEEEDDKDQHQIRSVAEHLISLSQLTTSGISSSTGIVGNSEDSLSVTDDERLSDQNTNNNYIQSISNHDEDEVTNYVKSIIKRIKQEADLTSLTSNSSTTNVAGSTISVNDLSNTQNSNGNKSVSNQYPMQLNKSCKKFNIPLAPVPFHTQTEPVVCTTPTSLTPSSPLPSTVSSSPPPLPISVSVSYDDIQNFSTKNSTKPINIDERKVFTDETCSNSSGKRSRHNSAKSETQLQSLDETIDNVVKSSMSSSLSDAVSSRSTNDSEEIASTVTKPQYNNLHTNLNSDTCNGGFSMLTSLEETMNEVINKVSHSTHVSTVNTELLSTAPINLMYDQKKIVSVPSTPSIVSTLTSKISNINASTSQFYHQLPSGTNIVLGIPSILTLNSPAGTVVSSATTAAPSELIFSKINAIPTPSAATVMIQASLPPRNTNPLTPSTARPLTNPTVIPAQQTNKIIPFTSTTSDSPIGNNSTSINCYMFQRHHLVQKQQTHHQHPKIAHIISPSIQQTTSHHPLHHSATPSSIIVSSSNSVSSGPAPIIISHLPGNIPNFQTVISPITPAPTHHNLLTTQHLVSTSSTPTTSLFLRQILPTPKFIEKNDWLKQNPSQSNSIEPFYPVKWSGKLCLKNDEIFVQMHMLAGNEDLIKNSMSLISHNNSNSNLSSSNINTNTASTTPPLRIVQRMRLEPNQLEGLQRRLTRPNEFCTCLTLAGGDSDEQVTRGSSVLNDNFIKYLQEKSAAGIINICIPDSQQNVYVIHIFPPCDFSNSQLKICCPKLYERLQEKSVPYLVVVITTV